VTPTGMSATPNIGIGAPNPDMVPAGGIARENAYGSPESGVVVGFVTPTAPDPGIGAWNQVTPGAGIADQIGETAPNIGSAM